jgi:two-component system, LytTR family, sensor kinase
MDRPALRDSTETASRWSSMRFALATAIGAWAIYFAVAAIRCIVYGFPNPLWLIERHAVTAVVAVAMSAALLWPLHRFEQRPIGRRLTLALCAMVPPAAVLSVFNFNAMYVFAPTAYVQALGLDMHRGIVAEVLHSSLENYFVFAGWAVLSTAVSDAVDTQNLLRRAAASEAAARVAELKALRLQLDPHFLFNALNTVSGLIVAGAPDDADRAVEALSLFLRATLQADASADVPLADEIRLQKLYLAIEQIRFGERLAVVFDVPEALMAVRVPALILQPLVENSIRHAVARTLQVVTVTIAARIEDGRLRLSVEDDGPGTRDAGLGVGLGNVAGRLSLRHPGAAAINYGRTDRATTSTVIELPVMPDPARRLAA